MSDTVWAISNQVIKNKQKILLFEVKLLSQDSAWRTFDTDKEIYASNDK